MIVASSTSDRESEQPSRHDINSIIDNVILIVQVATSYRQKSKGRQPRVLGLIDCVRSLFVADNQVRRELFRDELIERSIRIERVDHVIPVGVRVGVTGFCGEDISFGIGVSGNVEPMSTPSLAVEWRGKESINLPLCRVRRRVGFEFS